jgi:hypothetical protein
VPALDIVQEPIVALAHHGVDRTAGADTNGWILGQHPIHQCVSRSPYAQGVGQQKRRLNQARFAHLIQAGAFAKAIEHVNGRRNPVRVQIAAMRADGSYAAAYRPNPDLQWTRLTSDKGGVTYQDAGHVGDGVQAAGWQ